MRRVVLMALAVAFLGAWTWAQTEELPTGWPDLEGLAPLSDVPVLEAPPIQARAAAARATAASRAAGGGPYRFAEPFEVEATPASHGRWETTADGATAVWRLRVRSEGAVSLNLGFTRYRMPAGGFLRLRTPDGEEVVGPFTEADNKAHGELWTPILSGGDLVVEVSVPVERAGELELQIGSVNRGFRDLAPDRVSQPSDDSCPVDVVCSAADDYRDQVRSVGLYIHSGSGSCTGAMLNNASGDGTPYFLTARHCGFDESGRDAATRSLVVFWNYESPTCGERSGGTLSDYQRGAEYVTGTSSTDYALLKLDPPDPDHNVFFAGWDHSEADVDSAVLIHHPAGKIKAISTAKTVTFGTYGGNYAWWLFEGCHGVEGGSSGSPLFDRNGRVISQITGYTWRSDDPVTRWQGGRLSRSWTRGSGGGLGDWLDPDDSGATGIDGRNASYGPRALEDLDELALKFVEGETPESLAVDVSYGFLDPDGHELTYAASSSDDTVATVSVSGSTLTLTPASAGTATVTVTVTDADGANESASQEFEVTVAGNASPEAVGELDAVARRLRDGAVEVAVDAAFRDGDSDALTYGASSSDTSVATVSVSGSTLTVTPVAPGVATVTATATDASGSNTTARQRFEAVVNRPPVLARFPRSLSLGTRDSAKTFDMSGWFEDPDGDALTYAVSSSDSGAATVSVSGSTLTVTAIRCCRENLTLTATDVDGSNLSAKRKLRANVANRPPVAVGTLPESVLRIGEAPTTVGVSAAFRDAERNPLTYAASSSAEAVATVSVSGSTLTLTPVWKGTATVTVTATDTLRSKGTAEQQLAVRVLPAPGVRIVPATLRVDEGDSGTYTVELAAEPTGSVTVTPSVPSSTDVSVSPSSLTFTTENWETAQTATVSAVDDADNVRDDPVTIGHGVAGGGYGSVTVNDFVAVISENDPGVEFSDSALSVDECLSAAYTIELVAAPTADAVVSVSLPADAPVSVAPSSLTFTTGNWETARTVTVTPLADADTAAPPPVTIAHSASGGGYGALSIAGVTVTVREGDVAGVRFRPRSQTVREGGSGRYTVELTSQPASDVTLSIEAPADGDVSVDVTSLTFRPSNWDTRRTVTITASEDDDAVSEPRRRIAHAASACSYESAPVADVSVGVRENDVARVTVRPTSLSVREGGAADYGIVLTSEPTRSVTVTPSVPSATDLSVSPSSLTFGSSDWDVEQAFTVEAEEDADALSDPPAAIGHRVRGGDYGSVRAPSVTATIVENDASALSLSDVSGSESSSELVFTVTISVAGTSDVTVDFATSDGSGAAGARAGADYTSASGTLTFPQGSTSSLTIAVPLLDDGVDEEEEETFGLTLSNVRNGLLAGGGSRLRVTGTIEDDDDPPVAASFGRPSYSVTEGDSVQVVVRLDKDPERTVTLPLESTPRGGISEADHSGLPPDVTFGPGERTFEFPFSAIDDGEDDDGEAVELSFGSFLPDRVTASGSTVLAINDNDGGGSPPGGPGGPGGPPPPQPDDDEDDSGGGGSGFTPPRAAIRTDAECADGLCRALTGVPVRFEDASTGSVQRRSWAFGEGSSRNALVNWSWSGPGFHEVTLQVSGGEHESTASLAFLVEASEPAGTCVARAETLCLQDSRFSVGVEWWTTSGERGAGRVVRRGTNDTGLFSFFGGGNWEMLVKVLDGCSLNGHVWVYGALTTDLGYRVAVTDTVTGTVREYRNEPGSRAAAVTDATAFPAGCAGRR